MFFKDIHGPEKDGDDAIMNKSYPNKNVDVCLISTSGINLGIRYLSSYLKEKGYTVVLGFFDRWEAYTDDELKSITGWIAEVNPRVLGFSTTEVRRDKVAQVTGALGRTGRVTVAGGIDATLSPEAYLPHVDFVIRGEGEEAFAELLDALLNGKATKDIRSLCYTDKDGTLVKNPLRPVVPDLDSLPYEDWLDVEHHFELQDGRVRQKENCIERFDFFISSYSRGVHLHTLRGCALSCKYCVNPPMQRLAPGGAHVRKRSVPGLVERVAAMKRAEPLINIIYFFEEDFLLRSLGEIQEFARQWKEKVNMPFFIFCTPLSLDEKKFETLLDAGLYVVNMGIQSGSEKTNYGMYDRKISNERTIAAMRLLTGNVGRGRFGFLPSTHDIIINNPYESRDDLLETIRLVARLPKPYYVSMLTLQFYQGTEIYEKAVKDGMVQGRDETTMHSYNDAPRLFEIVVRRGGDYYLNSLLFWMWGKHTKRLYGAVPAVLVPLLTRKTMIRFFNKRPGLISFINNAIPACKRLIFEWYAFRSRRIKEEQ